MAFPSLRAPSDAAITADGCWAEFRTPAEATRGKPCLFLDRDGVLIEDTGYPHDPEAILIVPEAIAAVAASQRAGFVAGIVSNQSGIGRGMFDWPAFAAVQAAIDDVLVAAGARLDFVLACPYHPEATLPHLRNEHDWRKPRPGMLLAARDALGIDMTRSVMIGDRGSDMDAAHGAGIKHGLRLGDPRGAKPSRHGSVTIARSALAGTLHSLALATGTVAAYEGR